MGITCGDYCPPIRENPRDIARIIVRSDRTYIYDRRKHIYMPSKQQLEDELSQLSIADERRFRRRLAKARSPKALAAIAADMMTARETGW